jgi:hypothetical protein
MAIRRFSTHYYFNSCSRNILLAWRLKSLLNQSAIEKHRVIAAPPCAFYRFYKTLALKVSHCFMLPLCNPALNQLMRCLLEPWVKLSGWA